MNKVFTTLDNNKIKRISRWIKIRTCYNLRKNNSLYYYCTDENGYREGQENFNSENGTYCDYFVFHGVKYALERFIRMGSGFNPHVVMFYDKDGKLNHLSGYDSENYYNPLMIEVSECGEYVRVYEEC